MSFSCQRKLLADSERFISLLITSLLNQPNYVAPKHTLSCYTHSSNHIPAYSNSMKVTCHNSNFFWQLKLRNWRGQETTTGVEQALTLGRCWHINFTNVSFQTFHCVSQLGPSCRHEQLPLHRQKYVCVPADSALSPFQSDNTHTTC